MHFLFLILATSLLNHNTFATEKYRTKKEKTVINNNYFLKISDDLISKIGSYCNIDTVKTISRSTLLSKAAIETMVQKGFIINMESIKQEDIENFTKLLFQTRNTRALKIKGLKWDILKVSLERQPNLKFDKLEKIDISDSNITNENLEQINDILFSRTTVLTSINLSNNNIGDAGVIAIIANIINLTNLNLHNNQIEDAGARAIARSKHMKTLNSLYLYKNQLGATIKEYLRTKLPSCNINLTST